MIFLWWFRVPSCAVKVCQWWRHEKLYTFCTHRNYRQTGRSTYFTFIPLFIFMGIITSTHSHCSTAGLVVALRVSWSRLAFVSWTMRFVSLSFSCVAHNSCAMLSTQTSRALKKNAASLRAATSNNASKRWRHGPRHRATTSRWGWEWAIK